MELMEMFPREHRFKGFFWDSPSIVVSITVLYLWIVLKAGPEWMKDRKPYAVKSATRLFNLFQVAANVWFTYNMIAIASRNRSTGHLSFGCNPPSLMELPVNDPKDWELLVSLITVYFAVRVLDFLDTVFFVLAKKQAHVSFLHVYHHVVVVMSSYIYIRSGWTPSIYYVSTLNSIVHICMYSYYLLSTFPSLRPYLWWKKYLTGLQLTQFTVVLMQLIWNTTHNCGYPLIFWYYNIFQGLMFLGLFAKFYFKSYNESRKEA